MNLCIHFICIYAISLMITTHTILGGVDQTNSLIVTFDVEDFTKKISLKALVIILKLLKKYNLRSLFFITGHMTERLRKHPEILQLLESHEIGYHSSSHSVRPTIPEFTDTRSYSKAIQRSLIRETSHINPLTGEPEGEGGIKILRETFKNKDIISFRAPGFCWTPPHLEALQKLGIKFDFSVKLYGAALSKEDKIAFKGIIFYPFPIYIDFWDNPIRLISLFLSRPSRRKIVCLCSHEWSFASWEPWDLIYWRGNPENLITNSETNNLRIMEKFLRLDMFLKGIKLLEKFRVLTPTPILEARGSKPLDPTTVDVAKTYQFAMRWAELYFDYHPKYMLPHFYKYFDQNNIDYKSVHGC